MEILKEYMPLSNISTHFYVVGVNYKNADLKRRGNFSLNVDQRKKLILDAKALGLKEILVISTCNRTEIYARVFSSPELLIKLLCKHSKGTHEAFKSIGYVIKNLDAIHHVFRVGTGLDSQIIGDFEIIGQVKQSFFRSKKLGMTHAFMERLINSIIQASKNIKTKTKISSGATSVAFASVQYMINTVKNISEKNILLFGTGKIGRNTCENLIKHTKNNKIVLINRTHKSAKNIAKKFNVSVKEHKEFSAEIKKADILIVATGAQQSTVSKEIIYNDSPLLILDLSVPSNVNSNVTELDQVNLVHLDTISKIANKNLHARKKYIPQAEAILEEVKNELLEWFGHRKYAPTLRALKAKLTEQQISEVKFQEKKKNVKLESINISSQIIQKTIGQIASYLKQNPDKASDTINVVKEVFQLDIEAHE